MPHGEEAGSGTRVREATAEDAEAIHPLAGELAGALGDSPPRFEDIRARLLELLEEPRARVLGAEGSRREGVGKLLMEEVRGLASENGANLIELVATTQNLAAREFYRALGFVETDHITLEFVGDMENP